jgi:hypothetical protein
MAAMLLRLAGRIVPEVAQATPEVRSAMVDTIDHALTLQPWIKRLEIQLLVLALTLITLPLWGSAQDAVLRFFQNGPITLMRVALWGLKTFVFMGYYTQAPVIAVIHYAPSLQGGNDLLHRAASPG